MGILTEQNILGNPALGAAVRPGSTKSVAEYAFASMRAAGAPETIINSKFTAPSPYSIDALFGTVTKSGPTVEAGINGDPIVFPDAPTAYGPGPFNSLPDSQQTNLGAAAEVVAGNAPAVESPITQSTMSQTESLFNKEYAGPEPQASGAPVTGYDPRNQYYINKSAGATPEPESMPLPTASPGDAPEPPAESTSSAKSNDGGGFSQMDFMAGMGFGGAITPKAVTQNPQQMLFGSTPAAAGARTSSSDSFDQMEQMMLMASSGKSPKKPSFAKTSGASAKKGSSALMPQNMPF